MIRDYLTKDREQIIAMLKKNIILEEEEIDFILQKSNHVIVYEEDKNLLGFSTFRIWGREKNKADIYTYVDCNARNQGIGSALYDEIIKDTLDRELAFISSRMQEEKDHRTSFYSNRGYELWYTEHLLTYEKGRQPEVDLKFVHYNDTYFELYLEEMSNSFYELRRSNDFMPYRCSEIQGNKRKEFLDKKDNIYLLIDDGKLIGSVSVYPNGSIEDVFIVQAYQGKGYGRKIMQSAINRGLEKTSQVLSLTAIAWNVRALNMYQSLGFEIVQTTHYYRQKNCL